MSSITTDNKVNTYGTYTNSNQKQNKNTLEKDDFLKLLVTELKNQDPLQPADNKQFITEMAQFSTLEIMNNVAAAIEGLQDEISKQTQQSLLVQGTSLIGKEVTGTDADGQLIQGIVESIIWKDEELELQVGDSKLKLTEVSQVTPQKSE